MKRIFKLGKWLLITSIVFFVIYNTYFGWNKLPIDDTEKLFDDIYYYWLYTGLFFYFLPIFKMYSNIVNKKYGELDLKKNRAKDIDHIEMVMNDILGCEKGTKNPLDIFYIAKYSVLNVKRILDLRKYLDFNNFTIISKVMNLANKGYNNKKIIDNLNSD